MLDMLKNLQSGSRLGYIEQLARIVIFLGAGYFAGEGSVSEEDVNNWIAAAMTTVAGAWWVFRNRTVKKNTEN